MHKIDWGDMQGLATHIEGHIGFFRDAVVKKDHGAALQQAREIEGWAQAMIGELEPDQIVPSPSGDVRRTST